MTNTYAIGDIHGCRRSLENLTELISPTPDDLIVCLGDYGDRGPDTKGCIDFILSLRETHQVITLRGNHEIQMLGALDSREGLDFWLSELVGGTEALASYGDSLDDIPESHWAFIRETKILHQNDTHVFVHGGLQQDLPICDHTQDIACWERFYKPQPHVSGKTMICGHTIQPDGLPTHLGHAVCIDTHAYGGGWLTALNPSTGEILQANEAGQSRRLHLSDLKA